MSLVVVGSIAFDAVKTPFGERERTLGGSAVHFSLAASFFGDVRVVGPVGDDFGEAEYAVLRERGVNTDDIEHVEGEDLLLAGRVRVEPEHPPTLDTQLNVFGGFQPKLSEASKQADVLFLANIQPDLQREVREQCRGAKLAGLDSMNLWIETARESLVRTIGSVDMVLMNDDEIRMLTKQPTMLGAARAVMDMGPRVLVIKQGEYGAALFTEQGFFSYLPTRSRPCSIPPAPATPSPAASSASSTAATRRARAPATRDDLRFGARLVLGRGLRLRAGAHADPRGDRRALCRLPAHDRDRRGAGGSLTAGGPGGHAALDRGTISAMSGFWAVFWLAVVLKVPIIALLWIIWWAVREPPQPDAGSDEDGGSPHDHPHPRLHPPGPRRRGPTRDPGPGRHGGCECPAVAGACRPVTAS